MEVLTKPGAVVNAIREGCYTIGREDIITYGTEFLHPAGRAGLESLKADIFSVLHLTQHPQREQIWEEALRQVAKNRGAAPVMKIYRTVQALKNSSAFQHGILYKVVHTQNDNTERSDLTKPMSLTSAKGQLTAFYKTEKKRGYDGDRPYYHWVGTKLVSVGATGHKYTVEDHRDKGYIVGNITPETGGGWFRYEIVPCDKEGHEIAK